MHLDLVWLALSAAGFVAVCAPLGIYLKRRAEHQARVLTGEAPGAKGSEVITLPQVKAEPVSDQQLWRWTAAALAEAIRKGEVSSREATQSVLARIEAVNPRLNAFTVVTAAEALKAADLADAARARGESLGVLHGVPVTIKDSVDQERWATTQGVPQFKDLIAKEDSPIVASLRRAGAVIVGRTTTPDFCLRLHTDSSLHGRTYNPWHKDHTPGGSSGGAAAALASGMGPLAIGSDLGGSIRFPAYACGVAGLRPTLGRVAAYNSTQAQERPIGMQLMSVAGPMARKVADLRLGLEAITVHDARDPWWVPAPLDSAKLPRPIRVALSPDPAGLGVHPEIANAVKAAGKALQDAGYVVEEVEPPNIAAVRECYHTIIGAEIRNISLPFMRSFGETDTTRAVGFMLENMPEIDTVGYMKALSERSKHLRDWLVFLERYQLVVAPVSCEPTFEVGFDLNSQARSAKVMRAFRMLSVPPLLGLPAVAVPVGSTGGLPLGVQVIGSRYREDLCLDAAEVIEMRHGLPTPIDPRF
jgi:amidase